MNKLAEKLHPGKNNGKISREHEGAQEFAVAVCQFCNKGVRIDCLSNHVGECPEIPTEIKEEFYNCADDSDSESKEIPPGQTNLSSDSKKADDGLHVATTDTEMPTMPKSFVATFVASAATNSDDAYFKHPSCLVRKKYTKRKVDAPYALVPLKNRSYNPEEHCGVVEVGGPCTRAITCKHHTVADKRKVSGRTPDVTGLIRLHKEKARRVATESEKEKSKWAKKTSRTRSGSGTATSAHSRHKERKERRQDDSSSHKERTHASKDSRHASRDSRHSGVKEPKSRHSHHTRRSGESSHKIKSSGPFTSSVISTAKKSKDTVEDSKESDLLDSPDSDSAPVTVVDNAEVESHHNSESDEETSSDENILTYYGEVDLDENNVPRPMPKPVRLHRPVESDRHTSTSTRPISTVKKSTKKSKPKKLRKYDPFYFDTSGCYYYDMVESTNYFLKDNNLPRTPEPVIYPESTEDEELEPLAYTIPSSSPTAGLGPRDVPELPQPQPEPDEVTTSLSAPETEEPTDIPILLPEIPYMREIEEDPSEDVTFLSYETPHLSPAFFGMPATPGFSLTTDWLDHSSEMSESLFKPPNLSSVSFNSTFQSQESLDASTEELYEFAEVPDESPEAFMELFESSRALCIEPAQISVQVPALPVQTAEVSAEPLEEPKASPEMSYASPEVSIELHEVSVASPEIQIVYDSMEVGNITEPAPEVDTSVELVCTASQHETGTIMPQSPGLTLSYMFCEEIEVSNFLEEAINLSLGLTVSSPLNFLGYPSQTDENIVSPESGVSDAAENLLSEPSVELPDLSDGDSMESTESVLVDCQQQLSPLSSNHEKLALEGTEPISPNDDGPAYYAYCHSPSGLFVAQTEEMEEESAATATHQTSSIQRFSPAGCSHDEDKFQVIHSPDTETFELPYSELDQVSETIENNSISSSAFQACPSLREISLSREITCEDVFASIRDSSSSEELEDESGTAMSMEDISPTAEVEYHNDEPLVALAPRKLQFEYDALVSMDRVLTQVVEFQYDESRSPEAEQFLPESPQPIDEIGKYTNAETEESASQNIEGIVENSGQSTPEATESSGQNISLPECNSLVETVSKSQNKQSQPKQLFPLSPGKRGPNRSPCGGRRYSFSKKHGSKEPYVTAHSRELYVSRLLHSVSAQNPDEVLAVAAAKKTKAKYRNWTTPWCTLKRKQIQEDRVNNKQKGLGLRNMWNPGPRPRKKPTENPSPLYASYEEKLSSPPLPEEQPVSPASAARQNDLELLEMLTEHTRSLAYRRMHPEKTNADLIQIYEKPQFNFPGQAPAETTVGMFSQGQADLSGLYKVPYSNSNGEAYHSPATCASGMCSCCSSSSSCSTGFQDDSMTSTSNDYVMSNPEPDNGIPVPACNSEYDGMLGSFGIPYQSPSPIFMPEAIPFGTTQDTDASPDLYGDFNVNEQFPSNGMPSMATGFNDTGIYAQYAAASPDGYNSFQVPNNTEEISNALAQSINEGYVEPMNVMASGNYTQTSLSPNPAGIYNSVPRQNYIPSANPQLNRGRSKKRAVKSKGTCTRKPATVTTYPGPPPMYPGTEFQEPQMSSTEMAPSSYVMPPPTYEMYTEWNAARFRNSMEETALEYQNTSNLLDAYNFNSGNMNNGDESSYSVPVVPSQMLYDTGMSLNQEIGEDYGGTPMMFHPETPQQQWLEPEAFQPTPNVSPFPHKWSNGPTMTQADIFNEIDDNFNLSGSQLFQAVLNE